MNKSDTSGKLIIISGPSGVGKSSVVGHLLEHCELPLELSVSATTRKPRPGETDGVNYHFLTDDEFKAKRDQNEFLEYVEVFGIGHWYGTLEQPVRQQMIEGKMVILEIDVQGAMMVMNRFPDVISIFIHAGSLDELEQRLRGRNTEAEEQIQKRLAVAADELELAQHYQHLIKNDEIKATAENICSLLNKTGEQKSCTKN